jgi:hypothetical protein
VHSHADAENPIVLLMLPASMQLPALAHHRKLQGETQYQPML